MIKKTVTYKVFEKEDVERIISKFLGKEVKISEMDVEMIDLISCEYELVDECELDCLIKVDGKNVIDEAYLCPLVDYIPNQALLDEKYIFAFDVREFKSYCRYMDNSD